MSNIATTNGTGPSIAKATSPARDLKSYLSLPAVRAKLVEAAGSAMKPDDLVRLTLIAASRTPELARCTFDSVLRALMDAAALGIKPGGLMGRGYLVPRSNKKNGTVECNFDPGWRGLVDVARRSGKIRRIEAHVVYEADEFVVERTPLTSIRHVPTETANPGAVRAAYAVAEFTGGEVQIEILYRRDLDKIRRFGAQNGPWANWYDEMARKSAVRRLCKYLPFDPQLEAAIAAADRADNDGDMDIGVSDGGALPIASVRGDTKALEQDLLASTPTGPVVPDLADTPRPRIPYVETDPLTGEVVPEFNERDFGAGEEV